MGNTYSDSDPTKPPKPRPEGLRQLNDSVWELYHPEDDPEVEVIFFHGLQISDYKEAFWKTWLSRDETVVWPQAWLGPSLQDARISSISYDSSARRTSSSGVTKMYQIIENLMHDVVLSSTFEIDEDSKVILVGHSMGGLIIKQLLLKCKEQEGYLNPNNPIQAYHIRKIRAFLNSCRGIFYYATPHLGSELGELVAYADSTKHIPGAIFNTEIIEFLRILSDETGRINSNFSNLRRSSHLNVSTRAIGELLNTSFAGFSKKVVPEASARHEVDWSYTVATDHFQVCRAENNTFSNIFTHLRDFCMSCAADIKAIIPDPPNRHASPVPAPTPSQAAPVGTYSQPAPWGDYSQPAPWGDYSKATPWGTYSQAALQRIYSPAAPVGNYPQATSTGGYSHQAVPLETYHQQAGPQGYYTPQGYYPQQPAPQGVYLQQAGQQAATSGNYSSQQAAPPGNNYGFAA